MDPIEHKIISSLPNTSTSLNNTHVSDTVSGEEEIKLLNNDSGRKESVPNPTKSLHLPEILNVEFWEYLGEGNANVVFKAKLSHPEIQDAFHCTDIVLRLKKSSISDEKAKTSVDYLSFLNTVLKPLFPLDPFPKYELVRVSPVFLNALQQKLINAPHRPSSRHSTGLDLSQLFGLLCPNYTARGVLCIEVKPKWLVPSAKLLPSKKPDLANQPRVTEDPCVCRFCLHQKLRLHTHTVAFTSSRTSTSPSSSSSSSSLVEMNTSTISTVTTVTRTQVKNSHTGSHEQWQPTKFCPLDLLSITTLPKAVTGLLESPNNNLRLWEQGLRMDVNPSLDHVKEALVAALTHVQPLLHLLSYHQCRLDDHASSVCMTCSCSFSSTNTISNSCSCCYAGGGVENKAISSPSLSPTLHEWHQFIQAYLGEQKLNALLAYTLSKTLKDCSIFITLSSLHPTQVLDCVLLDLDPKPLDKLQAWLTLEKQIQSMINK